MNDDSPKRHSINNQSAMKYPSPETHRKNGQIPFSADPSLSAAFSRGARISTSPPQVTGPKPVSRHPEARQAPPPQEPLSQARFTGTGNPANPDKYTLQPLVDRTRKIPPLSMPSTPVNRLSKCRGPKLEKTFFWPLGNAVVTAVTKSSPLADRPSPNSHQPFRINSLWLCLPQLAPAARRNSQWLLVAAAATKDGLWPCGNHSEEAA